MTSFYIIGISLAILLLVGVIFYFFLPFVYWLKGRFARIPVTFSELVRMKRRGSPIDEIMDALIVCNKGRVLMGRDQLEGHYVAGGDVLNVALGLVAAKEAGLKLSFPKAAAADFKGIDLVDAVKIEIEKRNGNEIFG